MRFQSLIALFIASICCILLSNPVKAQGPNDFLGLFKGVLRSAAIEHARRTWTATSLEERRCLEEHLHARGSSIDALVRQGIPADDPRILQLRTQCRQSPDTFDSQYKSLPRALFPVDGLRLGQRVQMDGSVYQEYKCEPLKKLKSCTRARVEKVNNRDLWTRNHIVHSDDGTASAIFREIANARFAPGEAEQEIERLSARFKLQPQVFRSVEKSRVNGITAIWGTLTLRRLNNAEAEAVLSMNDEQASLLISLLGNIRRSIAENAPIYILTGGEGFVWTATYTPTGEGALKFAAVSADDLLAAASVATISVPTQAPISQVDPAAKERRDAQAAFAKAEADRLRREADAVNEQNRLNAVAARDEQNWQRVLHCKPESTVSNIKSNAEFDAKSFNENLEILSRQAKSFYYEIKLRSPSAEAIREYWSQQSNIGLRRWLVALIDQWARMNDSNDRSWQEDFVAVLKVLERHCLHIPQAFLLSNSGFLFTAEFVEFALRRNQVVPPFPSTDLQRYLLQLNSNTIVSAQRNTIAYEKLRAAQKGSIYEAVRQYSNELASF